LEQVVVVQMALVVTIQAMGLLHELLMAEQVRYLLYALMGITMRVEVEVVLITVAG
jgi:hypothetical protein